MMAVSLGRMLGRCLSIWGTSLATAIHPVPSNTSVTPLPRGPHPSL